MEDLEIKFLFLSKLSYDNNSYKKYLQNFDLQYFQGEKTESPTPKKRREAREKGQVVQSKELASSISLLAVFLSIPVFSNLYYGELVSLYRHVHDVFSAPNLILEEADLAVVMLKAIQVMFVASLPFLLIASIIGLIVTYMQVGVLFTLEPLKFSFEKISFLKGLKKMFSLKPVVEMTKSILKALGIVYISYSYLKGEIPLIISVISMPLNAGIKIMWDICFAIVWRSSLFMLLIAILDFAYKKWENEKNLKMSKQEIKDEYKQMEGDPFIKGKIKEKQREMAMSRMMQEVPKADVIITNPTHYAVAIRYDSDLDDAPLVLAKGKGIIALNIRKIAEELEIAIIENKNLARLLYSDVEIGDEIPSSMYEAVADILAYVFNINKGRKNWRFLT